MIIGMMVRMMVRMMVHYRDGDSLIGMMIHLSG